MPHSAPPLHTGKERAQLKRALQRRAQQADAALAACPAPKQPPGASGQPADMGGSRMGRPPDGARLLNEHAAQQRLVQLRQRGAVQRPGGRRLQLAQPQRPRLARRAERRQELHHAQRVQQRAARARGARAPPRANRVWQGLAG